MRIIMEKKKSINPGLAQAARLAKSTIKGALVGGAMFYGLQKAEIINKDNLQPLVEVVGTGAALGAVGGAYLRLTSPGVPKYLEEIQTNGKLFPEHDQSNDSSTSQNPETENCK